MDKKIKVLQVIGAMNRGGAESMIMSYIKNIDKQKFQVDFLYLKDVSASYDEEIEILGGNIFRINICDKRKLGVNCMKMYRLFKKYDVVHSHMLHFSGVINSLARLSLVPKRISHSHNTSTREGGKFRSVYLRFMEYLIYKNSTNYIACGKAAGEYLFSRYIDESEVVIINNAINTDVFVEGKMKQELITEFEIHDEIVIGHIGRFEHQKNHEYLIDIALNLKRLGIGFKMLLIGNGSKYNKIQDQVESSKLQKEVKLLGVRTDIPDCLSVFDVFVMPSWHEGLPVTIVEAQAAGLPCILSDRITTDVDLGLELIEFLPLENNVLEWVDKITSINLNENVSKDKIIEMIKAQGYDATENAVALEQIYI